VESEERAEGLPYVKGSETSYQAAVSMYEEASSLRGKVFALVVQRGEAGLTCDEAEILMAGRHQTISARFYELHTSGRIKNSGKCRRTRSGRFAVVYVTADQPLKERDVAESSEEQMGTYTIVPAVRGEIEEAKAEADALLAALDSWQITSAEDEEQAGQIMKIAHERAKNLDAQRKKVVTPAVTAQRDINALFKPAIDAWTAAKNKANALLTAVVRARESANRDALAKAAGGDAAALGAVQEIAPTSGTALRDEIEIKIIDESLIPREYLCIDWSALKLAAKKGLQVPGVEFVRKTKVQVKA
jgi:hypothetical protein